LLVTHVLVRGCLEIYLSSQWVKTSCIYSEIFARSVRF